MELGDVKKFMFDKAYLIAEEIQKNTDVVTPHNLWKIDGQSYLFKLNVLEYDDLVQGLYPAVKLESENKEFAAYSFDNLQNAKFEISVDSDFAVELIAGGALPKVKSGGVLSYKFTDIVNILYQDSVYYRITINDDKENSYLWLKITAIDYDDVIKTISI